MATTLLDASETPRRLAQNLLIAAGIMLLVASLLAFNMAADEKTSLAGWVTLIAGFVAVAAGLRIKVRWQVDYRGHVIVVENDPVKGERLLVDGLEAGKGRLGMHNTMTAVLPEGDRIIVTTVAGFVSFDCRIVAETAGAVSQAASPQRPRAAAFE